MKYIVISTIFCAVILSAVSCSRVQPLRGEQQMIARVGDKKLYLSEAEQIFTPGMNPGDSLKVLESFVDIWVKKQLKVREAEKLFSENTDDIEKKVEEYRNSLLTLKLDQYYTDTRLDSLYDDSAVLDYYNNNKSEFLLDRPIVKGRVVRLPGTYKQKKQLMELMSGSGERYQDFLDISSKNDFTLALYDDWVDFGNFMSSIPVSVKRDDEKIFSEKGVTELKDGNETYLVYIADKLQAGDRAPLERVEETIKQVLYNQRKQEIIRNAVDSIYNTALRDGSLEVNVE